MYVRSRVIVPALMPGAPAGAGSGDRWERGLAGALFRLTLVATIATLALFALACGTDAEPSGAAPGASSATTSSTRSLDDPGVDARDARAADPGGDTAIDRDARRPRIVALGDSLTAGLGLPVDEAFPSVLQRRLEEAGYDFEVVNAGLSGDTSAGGLRRLDWALDGDVRILILALGANDGLRGLSIEQMRANLSTIIERAQARGILVLLAGMEALPNLGPRYTAEFREVYPDLAERYDTAFLPFLLDGVAGEPSLNQADGVHPNADGARRVADLVWPALQPLLEAATTE